MAGIIDLNIGAEALVDKAESFKTFLGLNEPRPTDRFFLVTGMTGAGKSSFVSCCTGHHETVSHGLHSCEQATTWTQFPIPLKLFSLILTHLQVQTILMYSNIQLKDNESFLSTLLVLTTQLGQMLRR